jgi:hypothetical protein
MKKPIFNFVVEIVPMKPSALLQAADIIQEVTNVARRLQSQQRSSEHGGNGGVRKSRCSVVNLGAHRAMAAG